jgi:hypothetical protein
VRAKTLFFFHPNPSPIKDDYAQSNSNPYPNPRSVP